MMSYRVKQLSWHCVLDRAALLRLRAVVPCSTVGSRVARTSGDGGQAAAR